MGQDLLLKEPWKRVETVAIRNIGSRDARESRFQLESDPVVDNIPCQVTAGGFVSLWFEWFGVRERMYWLSRSVGIGGRFVHS